MFAQCTRKFKRQQVPAIDLYTCITITQRMMGCHFGVLFTPVTQCHIGRAARSLSLFTEASYNSRLGGLCPDQSSVTDSEADLRHRAPVPGDGREPREVGTRHIPGSWSVFEVATLSPMLEIDIGPRE